MFECATTRTNENLFYKTSGVRNVLFVPLGDIDVFKAFFSDKEAALPVR